MSFYLHNSLVKSFCFVMNKMLEELTPYSLNPLCHWKLVSNISLLGNNKSRQYILCAYCLLLQENLSLVKKDSWLSFSNRQRLWYFSELVRRLWKRLMQWHNSHRYQTPVWAIYDVATMSELYHKKWLWRMNKIYM